MWAPEEMVIRGLESGASWKAALTHPCFGVLRLRYFCWVWRRRFRRYLELYPSFLDAHVWIVNSIEYYQMISLRVLRRAERAYNDKITGLRILRLSHHRWAHALQHCPVINKSRCQILHTVSLKDWRCKIMPHTEIDKSKIYSRISHTSDFKYFSVTLECLSILL